MNGGQEIGASIAHGKIDFLIFLDLLELLPHDPRTKALFHATQISLINIREEAGLIRQRQTQRRTGKPNGPQPIKE